MYQFHDMNVGPGGGSAALRQDNGFFRSTSPRGPASATTARLRPDPVTARAQVSGALNFLPDDGLRARLAKLDLVTDLGRDIGSRHWMRGFIVCAALCYSAYSFAPGIEPLAGSAPTTLADAQWEEARALSIAPLAYGGDTGRRMSATEAVQPLADTPERPSIELLATLGRGDGFARALQRAGVGRADAKAVAEIVAQVKPIEEIGTGTTASITLGRRPSKRVARPLDLLSFRASLDLKLEVRRIAGKLVLNRIPIAVDNTPLRIQGRVGASLYRAARAAGAPARAVESYIRAISGQVDIGRVGASDRFDMIIERRRAATGESEIGRLLYAGLDRSTSKDLQMMQWKKNGSLQWFEASGVGRSSALLQRPVPGTVSSNFGMRRHPILGYSRMHKGMDFRAGYGTPVLAATDGRIIRAGWAGGYGKQVRINHPGNIASSYSHMSRLVVQTGQRVRKGQVIGYVGSTGLSTGPHLHYELYKNGKAINPATAMLSVGSQLSREELADFRSKLRSLLSVPSGAASDTRSAQLERPSRPDRG